MSKRVWRQDYVAHSGRVLCARLGEKSGHVLATGGDDKRVNIWKVSKPNPMMSLTGHSTPVECVVFDKQEEVLVVGCQGGSMQVWNLEYRKMAGTLPGHRTVCSSVEFHPYGEFFASGSADTNLKIWDLRRKSCIQTYKGHSGSIRSIRFSPHGRWVATGGEDSLVKIWDLTAGKLMRDLDLHRGPITSLAFHPKEFILASGSADKTLKLWSLETFRMKASTELGSTGVQAVKFWPEDKAILSATQDALRVYSIDSLAVPVDEIAIDWKGLQDARLCLPEEKLLGISTDGSQFGIWIADLKREASAGVAGGCYGRAQSGGQRRSEQPAWAADAEDPEIANNPQPVEVRARGESERPEEVHPPPTPERSSLERPVLDRPPPRRAVRSPARSPGALLGAVGGSRSPAARSSGDRAVGLPSSPTAGEDQRFDRSDGPTTPHRAQRPSAESVESLLQLCSKHERMMGVLQRRREQAQRLKEMWLRGNISGFSGTLEKDHAAFCDFARAVMRQRLEAALNLDACQTLLPILQELLGSKYEDFVLTAVQFAEVLLQNFGDLIAVTRVECSKIPERQLDLAREERLSKCNACYGHFQDIERLLPNSPIESRFADFRSALHAFLQRC